MKKLVFVLVLMFVSFSCARENGVRPDTSDIAGRISRVENGLLPAVTIQDQVLKMTLADRMKVHKVPGVSIAVINDGKIEWAKGYGVTEAGGVTPVTVETMFQAASISKPVAVLGALSMVQNGLLDLDGDVNARLTSWKVPDNNFTKERKVTLRCLASHSAGLTVHGFTGYAAGEDLPTTIQVLDGKKPANSDPVRVDILPDSLWRYSGGGITVMQLLMTDISGKPFPILMRELVLDKIGMNHSTYEQPLPAAMSGRAASGHDDAGEVVKGKWHTYPEMAAAGLWTTPADLAKFAVELQQSKAGRSNKVLSAMTVDQMLTLQSGTWGLGIELGGGGKYSSFSHGGSNAGFRCAMFAYVESGQGAVIMTNGDGGDALSREILRAIADVYGWPDYRPIERKVAKVNPDLFFSYVGEYDVRGNVKVKLENDKLYATIEPFGGITVELYPLSETEFFLMQEDARIVFTKDDKGMVNGMVAYVNGRRMDGKKIK